MDILSLIQWRSETLNGERDPGKIISALSTKGLEGVPWPPASEGALVKFRKKDTKARLKVIAEAFAATGGQEQPEPSETPQNQARPRSGDQLRLTRSWSGRGHRAGAVSWPESGRPLA